MTQHHLYADSGTRSLHQHLMRLRWRRQSCGLRRGSINGKSGAGFTLMELLFSIAVFTIVMTFFSAMFIYNLRSYHRAQGRSFAEEQSRAFLKTMAKHIREMRSSGSGAYPLADVSESSITFYANADSDDGIERVRYARVGEELQAGTIQPVGDPPTYPPGTEVVRTIGRGVRDDGQPLFSYYDSTFTGTQAPLPQPVNVSAVRLVRIRTLIDEDPAREPAAQELVFHVQLRNLKDNY